MPPVAAGSARQSKAVADSHKAIIRAFRQRSGRPGSSIAEIPESERLFAHAALSRGTQVQLVELFDRRSCGNHLVIHWRSRGSLNINASRGEEEYDSRRGIGQSRAVSPLGRTKIGKPSGNAAKEIHQPGFQRCLLALALMEFAQEILPIAFLRALVALEGKQVFKLFDRWFHCG